MKVSVGNDVYNFTKYDKIQLIDGTETKHANGAYLLPRWKVICNDTKNNGVTTIFIRVSKTSSPTSQSGATSLAPIGNSFMYIETSSKNHGHRKLFGSFKRTDNIQTSNITFYYNRFSILTNDSLKSMDRFRFQFLIKR